MLKSHRRSGTSRNYFGKLLLSIYVQWLFKPHYRSETSGNYFGRLLLSKNVLQLYKPHRRSGTSCRDIGNRLLLQHVQELQQPVIYQDDGEDNSLLKLLTGLGERSGLNGDLCQEPENNADDRSKRDSRRMDGPGICRDGRRPEVGNKECRSKFA